MTRKIELVRTTSRVGEINLHLQLTPAYRRPIFADEQTRDLVKIYFMEEAKKLGVIISAMDFGPDHAHLFITNWKHCSLEKLANGLKGFTSYMMRKFHWDLFRNLLWGKKFWSAGYFYRTVGVVTKDAVKYYDRRTQENYVL